MVSGMVVYVIQGEMIFIVLFTWTINAIAYSNPTLYGEFSINHTINEYLF